MNYLKYFQNDRYEKSDLIRKLKEEGVLISSGNFENLRVVFHLDVSESEVETAVDAFRKVFN